MLKSFCFPWRTPVYYTFFFTPSSICFPLTMVVVRLCPSSLLVVLPQAFVKRFLCALPFETIQIAYFNPTCPFLFAYIFPFFFLFASERHWKHLYTCKLILFLFLIIPMSSPVPNDLNLCMHNPGITCNVVNIIFIPFDLKSFVRLRTGNFHFCLRDVWAGIITQKNLDRIIRLFVSWRRIQSPLDSFSWGEWDSRRKTDIWVSISGSKKVANDEHWDCL